MGDDPRNASYYRETAMGAVTKNVTVVVLGVVINYINGTLIHTFRKHQVFYVNPRYILFIHLVVNDMLQLTAAISLFVSSYVFYRIHTAGCLIVIALATFTSYNTPLNLAAMAAECYVAVCLPLRHAQLVTVRRTCVLIGCIWAVGAASVLTDVFVLAATEPLRLIGGAVMCENARIFTHPVSVQNMHVTPKVFLALVWLTITFAYVRIICAARAAKSRGGWSRAAARARNTLLLHAVQLLLSMLTYLHRQVSGGLLAWFPRHYVHVMFACYVGIQMLPRLVSPAVYGLRDRTFRLHLRKYLLCA